MNVLAFGYWRHLTNRLIGVNPLIRRSDRFEAFTQLCIWILAVVLVAPAAAIGTEIYDSGYRNYQVQKATRHTVEAMAVKDSSVVIRSYNAVAIVSATWTVGGVDHHGTVGSSTAVKAGEHFPVWVDQAGNSVAPPTTPSVTAAGAITIALCAWALGTSLVALIAAGVRLGLNKTRYAQWDEEIRDLITRGKRSRGW